MKKWAFILFPMIFLCPINPFCAHCQGLEEAYETALKRHGVQHASLGPTGQRLHADRLLTDLGVRGDFCSSIKDPIGMAIGVNGFKTALFLADQYWTPSHWRMIWKNNDIKIIEDKFITFDDMVVIRIQAINRSEKELCLDFNLFSPMTPWVERHSSEHRSIDLSDHVNMRSEPWVRFFTNGLNIRGVWREGEDPDISKHLIKIPDLKASKGLCLSLAPYSQSTYEVHSPELKQPMIQFRYAMSGHYPADLDLIINGVATGPLTLQPTQTGAHNHWTYLEFFTDLLKPGENRITLKNHTPSQACLDGFFITEKGLDPLPLPQGGTFDSRIPELVVSPPNEVTIDGIPFSPTRVDPNGALKIIALKGGIEGDRAFKLPQSVTVSLPNRPKQAHVIHLLTSVFAPRGEPAEDAPPASLVLTLDDDSLKTLDWPKGSMRSNWRPLTLPGMGAPLHVFSYGPPEGRYVKTIKIVKGQGRQIPTLFAGTLEILPADGKPPLLLGKTVLDHKNLNIALAGQGFALSGPPYGRRQLIKKIRLSPREKHEFNGIFCVGEGEDLVGDKALAAVKDPLLLKNHMEQTSIWFKHKPPVFICSDPFLEKAWQYQWFLVKSALSRGVNAMEDLCFLLMETRWLRDRSVTRDVIKETLKNHPMGVDCAWFPDAVYRCFEAMGDPTILRSALPVMVEDFKWTLQGSDRNRNALPAMPLHPTGTSLERPELAANLYANSIAIQRASQTLGLGPQGEKFEAWGEKIREGVKSTLWISEEKSFYPAYECDQRPVRLESPGNLYPYFHQLFPQDPQFLEGLDRFMGANLLQDFLKGDEGFKNYGVLLTVLGNLLQENKRFSVTHEHFIKILNGRTRLYFQESDLSKPMLRRPGADQGDLFLSSFNDPLIQYLGGLVPSANRKSIGLAPIMDHLDYFCFQKIPYHDMMLDIFWDRPDWNKVFEKAPEGYTLFINNKQVFHSKELTFATIDL